MLLFTRQGKAQGVGLEKRFLAPQPPKDRTTGACGQAAWTTFIVGGATPHYRRMWAGFKVPEVAEKESNPPDF